MYFAFIPSVAEYTLGTRRRTERGKVARDLFTFGHFPIVTGILAYAVVGQAHGRRTCAHAAQRRSMAADQRQS